MAIEYLGFPEGVPIPTNKSVEQLMVELCALSGWRDMPPGAYKVGARLGPVPLVVKPDGTGKVNNVPIDSKNQLVCTTGIHTDKQSQLCIFGIYHWTREPRPKRHSG